MPRRPTIHSVSSGATAARRTRVVHLCARLPVGGMENVVALLSEQMPAGSYETEIWCLEEADRLGRELLARGLRLLELGKRHGREPGLFFRLARMLHARQIDLLHCHDELGWFYGTIASRLAQRDVRVVVTMHGRRPGIARRHLVEQRLLALATSSVVCVSEFLRQQLVGELNLAARRVVTVQNGIAVDVHWPTKFERRSARAELGLPEDGMVIGTVGELSAVKNLSLALEALHIARRSAPSLRLAIIGDGAERDALKHRAAELGLSDAVLFAGTRRNVPQLLPAFDVYVCTSDYEGISLAILEAMAVGRPVVGTEVGGNPELIRPNETGVLVPRRDPEALASELVRMLHDDVLRGRVARGAQRLVREHYAVDRMIRDYDRLYQNILRLPARSRLNF